MFTKYQINKYSSHVNEFREIETKVYEVKINTQFRESTAFEIILIVTIEDRDIKPKIRKS